MTPEQYAAEVARHHATHSPGSLTAPCVRYEFSDPDCLCEHPIAYHLDRRNDWTGCTGCGCVGYQAPR